MNNEEAKRLLNEMADSGLIKNKFVKAIECGVRALDFEERKKFEEDHWKPKSTVAHIRKKEKEQAIREAEKLILSGLSQYPTKYEKISTYISPDDFTDGLMREVARKLFRQLNHKMCNPGAIVNDFVNSAYYSEVAGMFSYSFIGTLTEDEMRYALREAVQRVRENSLDQQIANSGDQEEIIALLKKRNELKAGRIEL